MISLGEELSETDPMTLKVPISTLRVFEAAARRKSFHAAASELNLTPSAVSHAVRKMEETLGAVLFERVGRGVSLSSVQPLPARGTRDDRLRFHVEGEFACRTVGHQ